MVILEILFDGLADLPGLFEDLAERFPEVFAALGYLVLGAVVGGLSLLVFPERVLPPGPLPGLSLVLCPLVAALAMEWWGRRRESLGRPASALATWFGGGALALGICLVRYLWVT